jgi:nucleoside-diphosphate-sugar epimerase
VNGDRVANRAAAELIRGRLQPESRVLVLGAGGWFGSTLLDLIAGSGCDADVLALTGRPRRLTVGEHECELRGWDWELVADFSPSLVVNCAFLTRERVQEAGYERYVAENVVLSSRFERTLALPSVCAAVTISSGAAIAEGSRVPDAETNPYGHLKRVEEIVSRAEAKAQDVALVVCRAWSVSGPFVTRPRDYAFSDLILQAGEGRVGIRAAHEVWRRYVGVDDLLAVCLSLAAEGWSGDVDSGGPLVELGDLAVSIVAELNPGAEIERPPLDGSPPDRYHSDDRSWRQACRHLNHAPASLEQQVRATAMVIAGS